MPRLKIPPVHGTLVGFCPDDEAYVVPYKKGETCPGCPNTLKKRLFYICDILDHWCEQRGFPNQRELREHKQEELYQQGLSNRLEGV